MTLIYHIKNNIKIYLYLFIGVMVFSFVSVTEVKISEQKKNIKDRNIEINYLKNKIKNKGELK